MTTVLSNILIKNLAKDFCKNPAKGFLVVALLVLKKWVSSEALLDGGSAENEARAHLYFIFDKL